MSWTRTTAIVTSLAQVTQLTGAQGLANLEDDLTGTDLLLAASKEVYDRLVRDGLDPTKFESETVDAFERCVAYTFLHHLALQGHLGGEGEDQARFSTEADRQYRMVRPKSTANSLPAGAGESLPGLTNQGCGYFGSDYHSDDLTSVL